MSKGIIAIVGRPNVGKSTFFNKITGQRISIVDDTPGVTRDRIYFETEWNGRELLVIDTGGIEPSTDSALLKQMRMQAEAAIHLADVIVFMCDVQTGVTAADRDIATMLIKSQKKVILAVNKVDGVGELPPEFYEFYELGFEDTIPVSALHGTGSGDVLDRAVELLPPDDGESDQEERIRVAVIGKPNAGKSSIINRIVGEERVIVSDIPGTTRDAVDTYVDNQYGKYVFIDTAGIRRAGRIEDRIEKYSVIRAKMAVERSDVCLIMIDAKEGVTAQDEHIAGLAHNNGKASVIVVNKWDLVEKDNDTFNKYRKDVYNALAYMNYAPTVFISAKTGQRVDKIFELINACYEQASKRITTGLLNDMLAEATARVQPPTDKGRRLKIYYMTQTGVRPPTFVLFCNNAELFHFSYQRYIENCLRETFGFEGTPIRLVIKQKGESID
ncbi:MAG TPA: ribosome biogenesis GTPase Der [Bacillota bacterium]|nr:ribosome biogenesis GTPase Der [Bacillota bacterium]HOK69291.1 ribosome biogenesis GTPase Der [Bacillota bacterium]HPP85623.1 ribosome biogenesis GTPase Der [Bacillota bacterium]